MTKLKHMFQRKEKKYLLSYADFEQLIAKLGSDLVEDEYGLHTISSLYFDTEDYDLIRASIEKPDYREKFRLRAYGEPQESIPVFLEIKKKYAGIVYKRRVAMPLEEVADYIAQPEDKFASGVERQVSQEISWLLARKQLEPKVMIAYERRAFFAPSEPEFRVTFDFNIRYRQEDLQLLSGTEGARVAPEIDVLMEVKALGAYPIWFAEALANLAIYPGSFTKYGQTYQRYLFKKESFQHVI